MKIPETMIEKGKMAKSAQELIALAKESGTELTEESAKAYFDQIHKTGELADDELDNVSGGCSGYASVSIDGHYYKLVNERTDSCYRFTCRACGGGRGNHAAGCYDRELQDVCMCCVHNAGHQLIGDYCKLQYK